MGQEPVHEAGEASGLLRRDPAVADQVDDPPQQGVGGVAGPGVVAGGLEARRLGLRQAEDEHVVPPDRLADLDVGPVHGADGQGAVEGELHVPGPGGLGARRGDLLREVARREDALGQGNPIVGQEDQLEQPLGGRIGVDEAADVVGQLDDGLGGGVTGGRLAGDDDGARGPVPVRMILDAQVGGQDAQDVQ